ncbi:MAG: SPOR domain-containing protein [Balneolaceae bacterium]
MKIDREKLIELLIEKTSMEAGEVESQLSELISRIQKASEKGKALEIKGFGMFYISEEGELRFDPSDELKTEVNFKYAGMDPVEIKKPRKEESDVRDEIREGLRTATDAGDSDNKEELKEEDKSPAEAPNARRKSVQSSLSAKGKKKDNLPSQREKLDQKEEKNPAATLITSIVTVLVIVIGVILAMDFGLLERNNTHSNQQQPEQQEEAGLQTYESAESEPDITVNEPAEPTGEESEPAGAENVEAEVEEEAEEVPDFGLYGAVQSIGENYYTIVLHSLQNENDAREMGENFSSEGYRAVVANVNVAGIGPTWRVGIGQFESISQAQQATQELPQRYRENFFIGLIQ